MELCRFTGSGGGVCWTREPSTGPKSHAGIDARVNTSFFRCHECFCADFSAQAGAETAAPAELAESGRLALRPVETAFAQRNPHVRL